MTWRTINRESRVYISHIIIKAIKNVHINLFTWKRLSIVLVFFLFYCSLKVLSLPYLNIIVMAWIMTIFTFICSIYYLYNKKNIDIKIDLLFRNKLYFYTYFLYSCFLKKIMIWLFLIVLSYLICNEIEILNTILMSFLLSLSEEFVFTNWPGNSNNFTGSSNGGPSNNGVPNPGGPNNPQGGGHPYGPNPDDNKKDKFSHLPHDIHLPVPREVLDEISTKVEAQLNYSKLNGGKGRQINYTIYSEGWSEDKKLTDCELSFLHTHLEQLNKGYLLKANSHLGPDNHYIIRMYSPSNQKVALHPTDKLIEDINSSVNKD